MSRLLFCMLLTDCMSLDLTKGVLCLPSTHTLVFHQRLLTAYLRLPEGADQRPNSAETKAMMLGERMAASYVASRYLWVIREREG